MLISFYCFQGLEINANHWPSLDCVITILYALNNYEGNNETVCRFILLANLLIFGIICKQIVQFIMCCLVYSNALVNFIAWHSILFECGQSLLGRIFTVLLQQILI